jgi:hypothetical protein
LSTESPHERAERYMRQATELAKLAAKSGDPVIAGTYLEMARVWVKLADDLKREKPADEGDDGQALAARRDVSG